MRLARSLILSTLLITGLPTLSPFAFAFEAIDALQGYAGEPAPDDQGNLFYNLTRSPITLPFRQGQIVFDRYVPGYDPLNHADPGYLYGRVYGRMPEAGQLVRWQPVLLGGQIDFQLPDQSWQTLGSHTFVGPTSRGADGRPLNGMREGWIAPQAPAPGELPQPDPVPAFPAPLPPAQSGWQSNTVLRHEAQIATDKAKRLKEDTQCFATLAVDMEKPMGEEVGHLLMPDGSVINDVVTFGKNTYSQGADGKMYSTNFIPENQLGTGAGSNRSPDLVAMIGPTPPDSTMDEKHPDLAPAYSLIWQKGKSKVNDYLNKTRDVRIHRVPKGRIQGYPWAQTRNGQIVSSTDGCFGLGDRLIDAVTALRGQGCTIAIITTNRLGNTFAARSTPSGEESSTCSKPAATSSFADYI